MPPEVVGVKDSFYAQVWRQGKVVHREYHEYDRMGIVPSVERVDGDGNSIPTAMRDFTAKVLFGGSTPGQGERYIAWGSSRAAFGSAQVDLSGEIAANGLSRALGSYDHPAGSSYTRIKRTFRATGNQAVRECGVFGTMGANLGTMAARQILATVQNLASADTIRGVWTFTH